jgi:hypothetical protein
MEERTHVVVLLDDTGALAAVWGTYTSSGASKVAPLLEQCYPGRTAHPMQLRSRHLPGRAGV